MMLRKSLDARWQDWWAGGWAGMDSPRNLGFGGNVLACACWRDGEWRCDGRQPDEIRPEKIDARRACNDAYDRARGEALGFDAGGAGFDSAGAYWQLGDSSAGQHGRDDDRAVGASAHVVAVLRGDGDGGVRDRRVFDVPAGA